MNRTVARKCISVPIVNPANQKKLSFPTGGSSSLEKVAGLLEGHPKPAKKYIDLYHDVDKAQMPFEATKDLLGVLIADEAQHNRLFQSSLLGDTTTTHHSTLSLDYLMLQVEAVIGTIFSLLELLKSPKYSPEVRSTTSRLQLLCWQWLGPLLDFQSGVIAKRKEGTIDVSTIDLSPIDTIWIMDRLEMLQSFSTLTPGPENFVLKTVVETFNDFETKFPFSNTSRSVDLYRDAESLLQNFCQGTIWWHLQSHNFRKITQKVWQKQKKNLQNSGEQQALVSTSTYHSGVVDLHCNPGKIAAEVIGRVRDQCLDLYAVKPPFKLLCEGSDWYDQTPTANRNLQVRYPKSHLDFMLSEVLKNAFGATMKKALQTVRSDEFINPRDLAPVKVSIDSFGKDQLRIRVEDEATGMSQEELRKCFYFGWSSESSVTEGTRQVFGDPQTVLQSMAGYGCGMPLVKCYTELFGGSISLETEVGKGTSLQLLL